jgi:hypothetical protein
MEGSGCEQIITGTLNGSGTRGNFGLVENIWFGRDSRGGGRGRGDHQDCSAGEESGHSQECQLILRVFVFHFLKKLLKLTLLS